MNVRELGNKIEGFDYDMGFAYCGEDDSLFEEMLADYSEEGKDVILNEFFDKKDWSGYGIDVHALKTTSRMVGLMALGDMCEALQKAAERADEAFINENHADMIRTYTQCVGIIKQALSE